MKLVLPHEQHHQGLWKIRKANELICAIISLAGKYDIFLIFNDGVKNVYIIKNLE